MKKYYPCPSLNRPVNTETLDDMPACLKVWIFRILCELHGFRELIDSHRFDYDDLARAVGLGEWGDGSKQPVFEAHKAHNQLFAIYRSEIASLNPVVTDPVLQENIRRIAAVAGLNEVDCRILEFVILLKNEKLLEKATYSLGDLTLVKIIKAVSIILDLPSAAVKESLKKGSALSRTGLLTVDARHRTDLNDMLDFLSNEVAQEAVARVLEPIELLRGRLIPVGPPELSQADYSHINEPVHRLLSYIRHVHQTDLHGVNVLLYGPPGTGKSQLIRTLAKTLDCTLYEVTSEDENGDPVKPIHRLRSYHAGQSFLTQNDHALLVFEEAEDIFPGRPFDWLFDGKSDNHGSKAWINRMLEGNKAPTFWISNSVRGVDPAYIRRFDMVIEMPIPPRRQREKIIKKVCRGIVSKECMGHLADIEELAPAVITRAVSVLRCIRGELPDQTVDASLQDMIGSTLKAQGHRVRPGIDANRLPTYYDPSFINTETDLKALARGLSVSKSGRICLYGPPGTGKTAFGRWLAGELDMPLVVKRASDLLSPLFGVAEQNMAAAFERAAHDEAVLMIDEVDTFVQDRRNATRSWEISMVNEFLTQLENHPGVFIASTNLMDGLDPATMRRFDVKLKFDYLDSEQAWLLFRRQARTYGFSVRSKKLKMQLDKLNRLTPGDFAVAARVHRFTPLKNGQDLVNVLVTECSHKEQARRAVGFV